MSLSELLALNPRLSPREPIRHGVAVTVLDGEWLDRIVVGQRLVLPEEVEAGVELLRQHNPSIEFPTRNGRPYAPSGTRLTLHDGITVSELARAYRISADDIIEANPPGSLSAETVLYHGDVLALPVSRITSEAIRHRLGLNLSLIDQYGTFLWDAIRFDFGSSWQTQEDSLSIVARSLPATVQLNIFALVIAVVLGTPLWWLASGRLGEFGATLGRALAALSVAAPVFWIAQLGIFATVPEALFENGLWNIPLTDPDAQRITSSPIQFFRLYGVPAFSAGLFLAGAMTLTLRNDMSRAALLGSLRVWLPVVFGFTLVLELQFNIVGLGLLLFQRVNQADMPVILAICVVIAWFMSWGLFMIDGVRDALRWREART